MSKDQRCEISPLVSYDGEDLGGLFLSCDMKDIDLPFNLIARGEQSVESVPMAHTREVAKNARTSTKYAFLDVDGITRGNFDLDDIFKPEEKYKNVARIEGELKFMEEAEDDDALIATPQALKDDRDNWEMEIKQKIEEKLEAMRKEEEALRKKMMENDDDWGGNKKKKQQDKAAKGGGGGAADGSPRTGNKRNAGPGSPKSKPKK
eukprot:gnl/TRDRNA2_/TRDRNA2_93707_c1_seq1.p1 gnl/TRDRNA2_/TRDRNA2_93707_c1~~gnl/TRDRNA2_/TRDRNA2_93707_c1_seq1.p1  ORF type:complete len:231 (-),score=66.24 gnl/TRDRNA2_/TRDRNA2_93707_c1_seq1:11-628(-)